MDTSWLAHAELTRARAAGSMAFRDRFTRTRLALRHLLGLYLGLSPGGVGLASGLHGKPEVTTPVNGAPDFNVSHAGDVALLAFAGGARVGIDIDDLRRGRHWRRLARRCLSAGEQGVLSATDPGACGEAFMRAWIRKEAYSKALGDGFSRGFGGISVSLAQASPGNLLLDDVRDPAAADRWWLTDLALEPPLSAALCCEGRPRVIRRWRYPPRTANAEGVET